ncbi:MAG TPA: aconitase X catalytic domain-containing protein [Candidatus Eisenbacteria bacterium]|nr:aconitase X catalytic domain-containing protein [Candidatus Eisenbacteria bacterium]
MYLTKEEDRILNGERGWANQTCMKILARLGDLFDAEKLIPITSAHVSGVSYKTLGDAPIEFLKSLADRGAKVIVRTTLNPQSLDPEYMSKKLPENLVKKQLDILKQFDRMGLTQSSTCTPYYLSEIRPDSHLAWAESSAVVYSNSILGSRTNREGGPSALAAGIIGKTPNYGIHKAENREPKIGVHVATKLQNETELGALGIYLGKLLQDKIPVIDNTQRITADGMKQLSAAIATTGMTNMFHCGKCPKRTRLETITVEASNIKQTIEELSSPSAEKPDLVFLGCPHCSLSEMKQIARFVQGKKVAPETKFWVCTSSHVKEMGEEYAEQIEKSGGHVLTSVCTIVSWTEKLGIESIMTNSAKTAYYAPSLCKAKPILAPMKECLKTALRG